MKLTIVAQVKAKDGKSEQLELALRDLIPPTLSEQGCELYQLHRSLEDPTLFHFHEVWTSKPDWETHMDAPHLKAFGGRADELVADLKLFQLEHIA